MKPEEIADRICGSCIKHLGIIREGTGSIGTSACMAGRLVANALNERIHIAGKCFGRTAAIDRIITRIWVRTILAAGR